MQDQVSNIRKTISLFEKEDKSGQNPELKTLPRTRYHASQAPSDGTGRERQIGKVIAGTVCVIPRVRAGGREFAQRVYRQSRVWELTDAISAIASP